MFGILISLLSGALMSIQGVFNTQVNKTTGIWTANVFVQFTAMLVCLGGGSGRSVHPFSDCGGWSPNICC